MLVPMTRVDVVVHRRRLDVALATLHRLGMVQVVPARIRVGRPYLPDESERAELAELRYLAARLDALFRLLPDAPPPASERSIGDRAALRDTVDRVTAEVHALTNRLDALRAEQEVLPRHLDALRRLAPLVPELPQLSGYETVALVLDRPDAGIIDVLRQHLTQLAGDRFELLSGRLEGDALGIVLMFPRELSEAIHAVLGREQVGQVRLPEAFAGLSFPDALVAIADRLRALPGEVEQAKDELGHLVRRHRDTLGARGAVASRIDQLEVLSSLGATDHATVVCGWVPAPQFALLERTLSEEVGEELVVVSQPLAPSDKPPVLLHNPGPARPFEFLVRLFDLPRYGSMDPTPIMALFMPLFFGMMLGDVVYGAILLALAWWASRRFGERSPVMRDLSRVLAMGSAWAILWGVLYGEVLGDLGRKLFGLQPVWINREEAIAPLLIFAVSVGVAHVVLALLLGVLNAWWVRDRGEVVERLGMLAALSGLFALAGLAVGQLPAGWMTPAVAALVVGMVVMGRRHGWAGVLMGPLEVVSLAGNVLSYLRIAAIGMASAYLARVANELGALGPLWIGVVVAALLHALNLALGAFSPTIQALRLHYVEFFGKFYEPGGDAFVAFGGKREA